MRTPSGHVIRENRFLVENFPKNSENREIRIATNRYKSRDH